MPIRVLPPEVASRIAAGEVVERPASVVKELVENALDAGATRVAVEANGGGLVLIRVSDSGSGIAAEEVGLAFRRHATSKLPDDNDLGAISTLGFRGEALPSIAAVSDLEVVTRVAGSAAGRHLRLEAGQTVESQPIGAPVGTTIAVRALFRRQPARLKFMRSPAAEAGQISTVVSHYALAYPEVAFSLTLDGRLTFSTPGAGSRREAVGAVYGAAAATAMLDVRETDGASALEALVGPPSLSRANRTYITIFVNRRWVRSRSLSFAVEEAYRGLLPVGRYPLAVVDLTLAPEEVDVNVHPAKAEVRLRNEREVFAFLQRPLRRALAGLAPVGSIDTAGAWPKAVGAQPDVAERRSSEALVLHSPESSTASAMAAQAPLATRVPLLRPLGQAGTTYVIAEGPSGLYLIDQHAAHERVLFERIRRKREAPEAHQGLLAPVALELTPTQRSLLALHSRALAGFGFQVEDFGPGRSGVTDGYLLRAAPAGLGNDPALAFTELLDLLTREDGPTDPSDRVAASMACHAAVRAGHTLSTEEMRDLIRQLEECETPQTCPHGRPTMLHISADELARRFARK